MNILKSSLLSAIALVAFTAGAQEPDGYYTPCEGSSGAALLTKLKNKISDHTNVGYDGLWNVYNESDVDANGKIWDMYSTKRWTPGKEHCGNYKLVGDCINREHSVPQSWFNDANPMKSDAFHVYPTDGKVNGQRSNFPYGECANGTTLPSNGGVQALGKLGTSTFPGYTGKVFEPVDEYKGDFARSYFYMAACYNDRIASWNSDMLAGNSYPAFKSWAVELLLKWHRQDPVSQKEIDRNNAIYKYQRNRNPFIDHPELAEHVWGNKNTVSWYLNSTADPEFILPIDGSELDFGTIALTGQGSLSITVKAAGLSNAVQASVNNSSLKLSRATIPATEACTVSGAPLIINWLPAAAGKLTATLTLKSGTTTTRVSLTGEAVDGLPALAPTDVMPDGFTARWIYVGDADARDCYSLHVLQGGNEISGYPKDVPAAAEQYAVTGLQSNTSYSYYLVSAGETSNTVNVTTTELVPSIGALIDVDTFVTSINEASAPALVELDTENLTADIEATIAAPFELSADSKVWSQHLVLPSTATTLYVRLGATAAGEYEATLYITSDEVSNDNIHLRGTVAAPSSGGLTYFAADGFDIEDTDPNAEIITLYNPGKSTTATNDVTKNKSIMLAADGHTHSSQHVEISFSEGTNTSLGPVVWYSNGNPSKHIRMYNGNTFTVTPNATSKITKVQIYFTSNSGIFKHDDKEYAPNNSFMTYEGDKSGPLTFTSQATTRPSYIAVTTENATNLVEVVVSDEEEALYYDLRGMRVTSPLAGNVYIKVSSSGAKKVIF